MEGEDHSIRKREQETLQKEKEGLKSHQINAYEQDPINLSRRKLLFDSLWSLTGQNSFSCLDITRVANEQRDTLMDIGWLDIQYALVASTRLE